MAFVRSFVIAAGVQPTLNLSAETLCRFSALAQERRGIGWCMRVYAYVYSRIKEG